MEMQPCGPHPWKVIRSGFVEPSIFSPPRRAVRRLLRSRRALGRRCPGPLRRMMPSPRPGGARGAAGDAATVCVGSWNMTHWTPAKAQIVAAEIGASILAVQETHFADFPLECAHTTAARVGLHLYHGRPVAAVAGAVYGRSCGVGFLVRRGLVLSPDLPAGAAWRRLHGMCRMHAVRLEPRPGLPRGVLFLSVYVPLQDRAHQIVRAQFVAALLTVCHGLDMQVPTLLMGDFNGSAEPPRDFLSDSGARREVCPLLAQLLGPGSPWVDVHRVLMAEVPWTYRNVGADAQLAASRIDLILANSSAMALVRGARVLETVADGGHSPVLVDLQLDGPLVMSWQRPLPRLPDLLRGGSEQLSSSSEWSSLVER